MDLSGHFCIAAVLPSAIAADRLRPNNEGRRERRKGCSNNEKRYRGIRELLEILEASSRKNPS